MSAKSFQHELNFLGLWDLTPASLPLPSDLIHELDSVIDLCLASPSPLLTERAHALLSELLQTQFVDFLPESFPQLLSVYQTKLSRYLSSRWVQPASGMCSNNSFFGVSFESLSLNVQRNIYSVYNRLTNLINVQSISAGNFSRHIHNIPPSHSINQGLAEYLLTNYISELTSLSRRPVTNLTLGSQLKLHLPKVNDTTSTNWHYDGDPFCIKLLLFLENQPQPDGIFKIIEPSNSDYSHTKTICQMVAPSQIRKFISGKTLINSPLFLTSSHNGWLIDPSTSYHYLPTSFVPSRLCGVIFRGWRCLHKGGNNTLYPRPVVQSILS